MDRNRTIALGTPRENNAKYPKAKKLTTARAVPIAPPTPLRITQSSQNLKK
jgi:hypothetical protein